MSIIAIVDAILMYGLLDDHMRYVRFLLTKTQKNDKKWEIFKRYLMCPSPSLEASPSSGGISFLWRHLQTI